MKVLILLATITLFGQASAQAASTKLFLECKITSDGVNPSIPRKFKAYVSMEERNWHLVYSVAGVSEEKFTLVAVGDIYQDKKTRSLERADFSFEDGTYLEIDFLTGIGMAKSDNVIFKHLQKAELVDCKILD